MKCFSFLACLLVLSAAASSQPHFSAWGQTYAAVSNSTGEISDPQQGGNSSLSQAQTFVNSQVSSGSAWASSAFYGEARSGVLKAGAYSSAIVDPNNPNSAGTSAVAFATNRDTGSNPGGRVLFRERILIGGAPAGTVVSFALTGVLTATIHMDNGFAMGEFRLQMPFVGVSMQLPALGQGPISTSQVQNVNLVSGTWVDMWADLRVEAYTSTDTGRGIFGSSDYIDASNTAYAYLKPLTPGATAIGETGYVYSEVVPEPGLLTALGVGLLGIVRRKRSNTRRS